MTKLIFFDLDGTLTESKQPLTAEMAALVAKLLGEMRIAVASGGALPQFLKQVVEQLPAGTNLANLYLLPTSGAALYEFRNGKWNKIYEERISENSAHAIEAAMEEGAQASDVVDLNASSYGPRVEYRGGQVTFSALGQQAPIELKKKWDPDHAKRRVLQAEIAKRLPKGFTAAMGGATTIDVLKEGVDKAYGIRKLCERLGVSEADALYVGDELMRHGNDEAVYKTKIQTKSVATPADTISFINNLLKT